MRNFQLSSISIKTHPTAPVAGKVLNLGFKLSDSNNESEYTIYADLFGFETEKDIVFHAVQSVHELQILSQMLKRGIIESLLSIVGNGKKLDWSIENLDQRIAKFENHWRKEVFMNALTNFDIKNKLSFEQAGRILFEYYVISPVMDI